MEWKKGWLLKDAVGCPFCKELVYPWRGYVCRGITANASKLNRNPTPGRTFKTKNHDIFLFWHIDCYFQETEEERGEHLLKRARMWRQEQASRGWNQNDLDAFCSP